MLKIVDYEDKYILKNSVVIRKKYL